jgi:hypothetical protein
MSLNSYKYDPNARFPDSKDSATAFEVALRRVGVDLSKPAFGITLSVEQCALVRESIAQITQNIPNDSDVQIVPPYLDLAEAGHDGITILSWLCSQSDGILQKSQLQQALQQNDIDATLHLLHSAGAITIEKEMVRITSFGAKYIAMLDEETKQVD